VNVPVPLGRVPPVESPRQPRAELERAPATDRCPEDGSRGRPRARGEYDPTCPSTGPNSRLGEAGFGRWRGRTRCPHSERPQSADRHRSRLLSLIRRSSVVERGVRAAATHRRRDDRQRCLVGQKKSGSALSKTHDGPTRLYVALGEPVMSATIITGSMRLIGRL